MTKPLPVTVVRAKATFTEALTDFIGSIILLACRAWLVMILVPHITSWHPSYWQSGAACLIIGTLVGADAHQLWTKRAP